MSHYYFGNTNRQKGSRYEIEMLDQHKFSAYGTTKEHVLQIEKGDIIFWYASGIGVIGGGIADGVSYKKESDGKLEYEFFQHLTSVRFFIQPLPYRKLIKLIPDLRVLNGTLLKLNATDGEKLWNYLIVHGVEAQIG